MIEFNDLQTTVLVLLAMCAVIGVFWNTFKITKEARQPSEDRNRRLAVLEEHDKSDNKRLEDLEKESRLTLKAQLVIIEHLMTNDGTKELQDIKDEIYRYLLDRKNNG